MDHGTPHSTPRVTDPDLRTSRATVNDALETIAKQRPAGVVTFMPEEKPPLTPAQLFRLVEVAHETTNAELRGIVMALLHRAMHPRVMVASPFGRKPGGSLP